MKKIIRENLFEFNRGNDPLDILDIGYAGKIHKFFDDLGISRNNYIIKDKRIFFRTLDLYGYKNLVELPENLEIHGYLNLLNCISLLKLPNNLVVNNYLELGGCKKIISLPDSLIIDTYIYLNKNQTELISFLKNSKFKDQYKLNQVTYC